MLKIPRVQDPQLYNHEYEQHQVVADHGLRFSNRATYANCNRHSKVKLLTFWDETTWAYINGMSETFFESNGATIDANDAEQLTNPTEVVSVPIVKLLHNHTPNRLNIICM